MKGSKTEAINENCVDVTVRFIELLTNGFRSSFEILAVRYELSNFIA